MIEYYHKRAAEYEKVYQKPERQVDLSLLEQLISKQFTGLNVLEVACGTGYWTQFIAASAQSIHAFDINESVLEIARQKKYAIDRIQFEHRDLRNFTSPVKYDALFGGFIWSHIPMQSLAHFLESCLDLIHPKGKAIFIDNKYVPGSSTPIHKKDSFFNTYQLRKLQSGETYEIIKNFPQKNQIDQLVENIDVSIEWIELEYYWMVIIHKR